MAKKKFVERRRQKAAIKCRTWLDARRCRDSISELLRSHGVVFETHWSEDENDDCDGEDGSHAILVGELMNESDMRLMERIAERDYWGTNRDIYYKDDFNVSIELKKRLRKLRSRNGWSASYEFWNPQMNKVISFSKS